MPDEAERKKFRSLATTLNYMSLDRSDVQYSAMEICTKAARYLKGVRKVTWAMRAWKHDEMKVDVHVDSDRAKGTERRSTSGGMMMINGTVVKHWSRTQVR